ncbi:unnamed protein product [Caenorhabditis auriculariae]|uniref:Brinker DNA-binding domain-containing protein n=1 Tax=Caenorhabditis auriculariae TaxID=2777116 RepID=A0A8S1HK28_9PELO|nr:unnamed protein product [Caenorhabditis auriculariae]
MIASLELSRSLPDSRGDRRSRDDFATAGGGSSPSTSGNVRTLKQYSAEEKIEIIDFAKINGNRAAGREFKVAESSIREWRKNEAKLRSKLGGSIQIQRVPLPSAVAAPEPLNPMSFEHIRLQLPLDLSHYLYPRRPEQDAMVAAMMSSPTVTSSPTTSLVASTPPSNTTSTSSSPSLSIGSGRRKTRFPRKIVPDEDSVRV